ncbi:MAG: hypothetical protein Q9214_001743 [Letrouitia sp. 1 TL-2023]
MQNTHNITASIRFLERSLLYEKEKPYTIDYRVPAWESDIERTNFRSDAHDVVITDIRGSEDQFTFDSNGFAVIEMESEMSYEDFQDRKKVETVFCEEMASSLLQYFNDAAAIRVFDVESSGYFDRQIQRIGLVSTKKMQGHVIDGQHYNVLWTTGVPHTAFDLPRNAGIYPAEPRESIEARVVICFEG